MTDVNLYQLLNAAVAHRDAHPEQRAGQSDFNTVHEHAPDIANTIRSGPCDPFYDNDKLPAFWSEVSRLLAEAEGDSPYAWVVES